MPSPPPLDVEVRVAALAGEFRAIHHCPTIAWGVVLDGGLAMSGAVGTTESDQIPTARTVYRIASMTKSFTAATVLALRDEGTLRLDDPITGHVPDLVSVVGPTSDAAPITLAHLLSMASGLASDDVWADRHLDITAADLEALIGPGAYFAMATGTGYEYSNLGFGLIGRIVERVTGVSVQRHVLDHFIGPLGLTRTSWTQPSDEDWARPYHWDGSVHRAEPVLGDGAFAPMGGLWSCLEDVAIWSSWLDDAFPARDGIDDGPLRRSSRREMQQIHRYGGEREVAGRAGPVGYGYGLLVHDDPRLGFVAGHSGGLPGYGSNMRWAPGRRVGAIALANTTYAPMAELTMQILDVLHDAGLLMAPPVPVAPELADAAHRLVALLNGWDTARADALFTDNVARDDPYQRRRDHARELRGDAGPLTVSGITALSAAAADIHLVDANGDRLTVELELAPLIPVRIESFSLQRAEHPDPTR